MERMSWIYNNNKKSKETYWVSLFLDRNIAVSLDYFEMEYIPKEALDKIKVKSIIRKTFRVQSLDPSICEFYCVAIIEYMIAEKNLLDYIKSFSPCDYEKNKKIK